MFRELRPINYLYIQRENNRLLFLDGDGLDVDESEQVVSVRPGIRCSRCDRKDLYPFGAMNMRKGKRPR